MSISVLLAAALALAGCTQAGPEGAGADGASGGDGAFPGDVGRDSSRAEGSLDDDSSAVAEGGPATLTFTDLGASTERLCDLDGDGLLDNAIADLGSPLAELMAAALDSSLQGKIEEGDRFVAHLPWIEDLGGPNDPDVVFIFYRGHDPDRPRNPDDDFDGAEPLDIDYAYVDGCGEPLYYFERSQLSITDGVVEGIGGVFPVIFNDDVSAEDSRIHGVLEPGGTGLTAQVCLRMRARDLAVESDFVDGMLLLEALLAGGAVMGMPQLPGVTPDLDLDGDGLERFVLDGDNRLVECIDGDSTVVPGGDCWQDPRMADAFAFVVFLAGVPCGVGVPQPGLWVEDCPEPPEESLWDQR